MVSFGSIGVMRVMRLIHVLDAPDLHAESAFWAGMLGGIVDAEDEWHSVIVDGEWCLGIQLAPKSRRSGVAARSTAAADPSGRVD